AYAVVRGRVPLSGFGPRTAPATSAAAWLRLRYRGAACEAGRHSGRTADADRVVDQYTDLIPDALLARGARDRIATFFCSAGLSFAACVAMSVCIVFTVPVPISPLPDLTAPVSPAPGRPPVAGLLFTAGGRTQTASRNASL